MPITEYKQIEQNANMLNDDGSAYDRLEISRRKEAILLSDIEKFRLFTKMMRIGIMLKNAKKYSLNR